MPKQTPSLLSTSPASSPCVPPYPQRPGNRRAWGCVARTIFRTCSKASRANPFPRSAGAMPCHRRCTFARPFFVKKNLVSRGCCEKKKSREAAGRSVMLELGSLLVRRDLNEVRDFPHFHSRAGFF